MRKNWQSLLITTTWKQLTELWENLTNLSLHWGIFFLFRATPVACGSSQARGWIGAAAAGLRHSHGNARSEPHLPLMLKPVAMPDPQPTERGQDWIHILMDTSHEPQWKLFTMGNFNIASSENDGTEKNE